MQDVTCGGDTCRGDTCRAALHGVLGWGSVASGWEVLGQILGLLRTFRDDVEALICPDLLIFPGRCRGGSPGLLGRGAQGRPPPVQEWGRDCHTSEGPPQDLLPGAASPGPELPQDRPWLEICSTLQFPAGASPVATPGTSIPKNLYL